MGLENKRCLISVATKAGRYVDNLARLSNSLRDNFDGDFLGFIHESSVGAPLHSENPYAFKVHAFQRAVNLGYRSVLWLDTSCYAVGKLDLIFSDMEDTGFIFQDSGHMLGNWSSDFCLDYFGIKRDDAMNMKMIGNAGFLGIDFNKKEGHDFLSKWNFAMNNGAFKGKWDNNDFTESGDSRCLGSRHDMSCSSAIVHQMGLFNLAYRGDQVLQYGGIFDKVINDTILIKAQG